MKTSLLVLLAMLLVPSLSASQDCIDYGDYLHRGGGVDTPHIAYDVAVSGAYAYIADRESGLQVIDIANPDSPQLVGSVDTPGDAHGVAVAGSYAYVADGWGLRVIDISDPTSPQLIGSVDTPGKAEAVAVSGSYAYVVDGWAGLQVIDITSPQDPAIVGSVDTGGEARGLVVNGPSVYVAASNAGLAIAWSQCEPTNDVDDFDEFPRAAVSLASYPNPFNPQTTIEFALDQSQRAEIAVYDLNGRLIDVLANRIYEAGDHSVVWDGKDDLAGGTVWHLCRPPVH